MDAAELPEQIGYLSAWFDDLSDWRTPGYAAIGPLSHLEIECWARLYRIDISPFEIDVLRKLDRELRAYYAERADPKSQGSIGGASSDQAALAAAVKAKKERRAGKG
jgi:hypothetical protein